MERLFRGRYRLGAEVNFGGSPAILAVDTKTDTLVDQSRALCPLACREARPHVLSPGGRQICC